MSYSRAKRIDAGESALEIEIDDEGHVRFIALQKRFDGQGRPFWTSLHTSGLYLDADRAEEDTWLQLDIIKSSARSRMTVNERLFVFGFMSKWDQAIPARNREATNSILSKVGLSAEAEGITDAALAK